MPNDEPKTKKNFLRKAISIVNTWCIKLFEAPKIEISSEFQSIKEARESISITIRKTMFTLLAFEAFVFTTLSSPDIELISEKTTMPILNTKINLDHFLIASLIITLGIFFYLHVFISHYSAFIRSITDHTKPNHIPRFLFDIPNKTASTATTIIFYLITPVFLMYIGYHSTPFNDLIPMLSMVSGVLLFFGMTIQWIRQSPKRTPKRPLLAGIILMVLTTILSMSVISLRQSGNLLRSLNFQGEDLRKISLNNIDLTYANLIDTKLDSVDLSSAHLEGTNLSYAHLEGANLRFSYLEGADLSDAHLEGADLIGVHLEGANLNYTRLDSAFLINAHLDSAHLISAHLEGANLNDAHLEGAYLISAYLISAHLVGANLVGADLRYADLRYANLRGTTGLTCEQLKQAKNWWLCFTDLDCGQDTLNHDSLATVQNTP